MIDVINGSEDEGEMTEEEKQALTEKINTYWANRPKASSSEEKQPLVPVHEFDKITPFTSDEHIAGVREFYEKQELTKS